MVHIYCNRAFFSTIKLLNIKISQEKISSLNASSIRDVPIIFKNTYRKVVLKDCLFISKFNINLISISLLNVKGISVIFRVKCTILDFKKGKITETIRRNNLYSLDISSSLQYSFNTVISNNKTYKQH